MDGAIAATAQCERSAIFCFHQPQAVDKVRKNARGARSVVPATAWIDNINTAISASRYETPRAWCDLYASNRTGTSLAVVVQRATGDVARCTRIPHAQHTVLGTSEK